MKMTVVVAIEEGLISYSKPQVIEGHVNLEQAMDIARKYGDGYPFCACVSVEDEVEAYYANYSNEAEPVLEDGVVSPDCKGHLELYFYHVETNPS